MNKFLTIAGLSVLLLPVSYGFTFFGKDLPQSLPSYQLSDADFSRNVRLAAILVEQEQKTSDPFSLKFDRETCTINREEYAEHFPNNAQDEASFVAFQKEFYNFNNSAIKFFVKDGFIHLSQTNPNLVINALTKLKNEGSTKINCRYPWFTFHNSSEGFWLPFSQKVYYNKLILDLIAAKKHWEVFVKGQSSSVNSERVSSELSFKFEMRQSFAPLVSMVVHELLHRLNVDNRPIIVVHSRFFKDENFDHVIRGNSQTKSIKRVLNINPDTTSIRTYNQSLRQCQMKQWSQQCKETYAKQVKPLFSRVDPKLKYYQYCSDTVRAKYYVSNEFFLEMEVNQLIAACQVRQVAFEVQQEKILENKEKNAYMNELNKGEKCSLFVSKANKRTCLITRQLTLAEKGLDCADVTREANPFGYSPEERKNCEQKKRSLSLDTVGYSKSRREKLRSDVVSGLNCDRIENGDFFEPTNYYYDAESDISTCNDLVEVRNTSDSLANEQFLAMTLSQYRQHLMDKNLPAVIYNQKLLRDRGEDTVYACDMMAGIDVQHTFEQQHSLYSAYLQGTSSAYPVKTKESFYQEHWMRRCLTCSLAEISPEHEWTLQEKLSEVGRAKADGLINRCRGIIASEDNQRRIDLNRGKLPVDTY